MKMWTARRASDKNLGHLFGPDAQEKLSILRRSTADDANFRLDSSHLIVTYVTLHCNNPPAGVIGEVTYQLTGVGYMHDFTGCFKSFDGTKSWRPAASGGECLVVLYWDECNTFNVRAYTPAKT